MINDCTSSQLHEMIQHFLPWFINSAGHIIGQIRNFIFPLIIFSSSMKCNYLFSDLWLFIYHFVISMTKYCNSRYLSERLGMPNRISHSLRFNFVSMHPKSQFSSLPQIILLAWHWYRWCSIVSIGGQKLHLFDCLIAHFSSFSLVFSIQLIIL